jgi:hypothetical protein
MRVVLQETAASEEISGETEGAPLWLADNLHACINWIGRPTARPNAAPQLSPKLLEENRRDTMRKAMNITPCAFVSRGRTGS